MKRTRKVTTIDMQVAARLRGARLKAGLSQEEAAAAIGISFQQVQKYEKGTNRITAGKLFELAKLYNKPIQWFFEDSENPARKSTPAPSLAGKN